MAHILLGDVEFDVIEEEAVEFINQPTEKPVEDGADIVDHVHKRPISLSIPGIIGDDNPLLARGKYETLKSYRNNRDLLIYVSEYEVLNNMVIERFMPRRNIGTGRGFAFNLTIKQIRVALRTYTDYLAPGVIPGVKKEDNVGRIQPDTKDVSDDAQEGFYEHLRKSAGML